jgi:membrane fusion protein (multidrug efflux system)
MFARVSITLGVRQQALVIPREALLESPSGVVVYRVRNERVEPVTPKLGEGDDKRVIVESGLDEGDVVAASGLAELTAGSAVRLSGPARSATDTVGQNP